MTTKRPRNQSLRTWRRGLGLNMAQAARRLGVGLRAYYLLERAVANEDRPVTPAAWGHGKRSRPAQPLNPCIIPVRKDKP